MKVKRIYFNFILCPYPFALRVLLACCVKVAWQEQSDRDPVVRVGHPHQPQKHVCRERKYGFAIRTFYIGNVVCVGFLHGIFTGMRGRYENMMWLLPSLGYCSQSLMLADDVYFKRPITHAIRMIFTTARSTTFLRLEMPCQPAMTW